ncbi:MAG: hypothetical protein ACRAVC_23310 [Trichormus sp.]
MFVPIYEIGKGLINSKFKIQNSKLENLSRGQGARGDKGDKGEIFTPMPNAQCPMPNAPCPIPNAQRNKILK